MSNPELLKDPLLGTVPVFEGYKVLGGVVLYDRVGAGGMGCVYRGRHLRLNIDVAVKVMSLPLDLPAGEKESALQRFIREARTAALVKHSNLVRVADVNTMHGLHFLTMDYIEGETASDRLSRKRMLSEAEAVEICLGAAEGLAEAHANSVVHRDVKPDNIMIDRRGRVTLTDLGLAKDYARDSDNALTQALSVTLQVVGTPYYMSPEQTRSSRDVGPAADVWSLGVTLYELATSTLPFFERDLHDLIHCIRFSPFPDPRDGRPDLSEGLARIMLKALGKDPRDRYPTCAPMAEALREHLGTLKPAGESSLKDPEFFEGRDGECQMCPSPGQIVEIGRAINESLHVESVSRFTPPPFGHRRRPTPDATRVGADIARALDDRTAFPVAQVLAQTIADLDPELSTTDEVWDAFIAWTSRDRNEYQVVRRTAHSIFYYQLQDFYEFGIQRLGRDDVSMLSGRAFSDTVYEEMLPMLLQIALRSGEKFQEALIEVFRAFLYRYTGSRYELNGRVNDSRTTFVITSRTPEAGLMYCQMYGLNPARAFRNSFLYIAGAMEELFVRIVADVRREDIDTELIGSEGHIHLPVTAESRFAFEAISQTLAAYARRIDERSSAASRVERNVSSMIAASEIMRTTWDHISRASKSEDIVLLLGESGTGKSYIARKIHDMSARSSKPFIEVGLTSELGDSDEVESHLFGVEGSPGSGMLQRKKGLFSLADGGTIFLDEIGDASAELQAKLLRVIEKSTFKRVGGVEDVSVNVRVVAATRKDLERMVDEGTFRRDLYFRLNVISIRLPALRERIDDVPVLADYLLQRAARKSRSQVKALSPGALDALKRYDWPGNIRELDHALKHASTLARTRRIEAIDLPERVVAGSPE